MVKKLQKMADKKKAAASTAFPAGLLDGAVAQNVKDSAQQIWAAGLASFAKAQGEGSKVFEALVSEGLKLQKKTQSAAEEKLSAVASKVSGMAGDVGSKAGIHRKIRDLARERGVLVNRTDEKVIRLLPALNVTAADLDPAMDILDAVFATVGAGVPA